MYGKKKKKEVYKRNKRDDDIYSKQTSVSRRERARERKRLCVVDTQLTPNRNDERKSSHREGKDPAGIDEKPQNSPLENENDVNE